VFSSVKLIVILLNFGGWYVFYWFSILFSVDGWVDGLDGMGGMVGWNGGKEGQRDKQVGGWLGG